MINAKYIAHMGDDLTVVNSARVSFGKFAENLEEKDIKLLNYLAKHQHYTPFEHCVLSVKIACPLYIRSQIHRHRTFSYNEVSRRYTDENLQFFVPNTLREQHKSSKQCSGDDLNVVDNLRLTDKIKEAHKASLGVYEEMIESGVAREIARGVLPQNLMTEFWMTGNLRNWIHFLNLRLDSHAQYEVQLIAKDVQEIITEKFPKSSEALFNNL